MPRKPADLVKLNLRFPEALRSRLEKYAARNNRSLNAEIVRRLENSFKGDDLEDLFERLAERTGSQVTLRVGDVTAKFGRPRSEEGK
jgi:plasmid stability protein